MNKPVEQFKPMFPPFEQPKRTLPFPAMTIGGYIVLAVALMITGHASGYSDDSMERLFDDIGAMSFLFFLVSVPLMRKFGTHFIDQYSRTFMNRMHFETFLMASVLAIIGMALMARHESTSVQNWCFKSVGWAIAWSMAHEYRFIISHRQSDA